MITSSTFIQEIKRGTAEPRLHNLSLSLTDIISNRNLLFNDTELGIDLSLSFRYASTIALNLALNNTSMPWGAPLYNFTLKNTTVSNFNMTHLILDVLFEVENHSLFDILGDLNLSVNNEEGEFIGSGKGVLNIPSNSRLDESIGIVIEIENLTNYSGKGYIEINFGLPIFNFTLDLGRFSYG
jgi:hypothetical protein